MKPDLSELPPAGPVAQGCPAGVPGGQTGAPFGDPIGPSEGASPGAHARNGGRPQGSAAVAVIEGKRADRSSKLSKAASARSLM